jgi:hypothetical protein
MGDPSTPFKTAKLPMNFTPISESGKQKLQDKVASSRSAWEIFLRTHEDSATV